MKVFYAEITDAVKARGLSQGGIYRIELFHHEPFTKAPDVTVAGPDGPVRLSAGALRVWPAASVKKRRAELLSLVRYHSED